MLATTPHDLRTARRVLDLTQADLAGRLGVAARTVRAWEAGHRTPPPFLRLALGALLDQPRAAHSAQSTLS